MEEKGKKWIERDPCTDEEQGYAEGGATVLPLILLFLTAATCLYFL